MAGFNGELREKRQETYLLGGTNDTRERFVGRQNLRRYQAGGREDAANITGGEGKGGPHPRAMTVVDRCGKKGKTKLKEGRLDELKSNGQKSFFPRGGNIERQKARTKSARAERLHYRAREDGKVATGAKWKEKGSQKKGKNKLLDVVKTVPLSDYLRASSTQGPLRLLEFAVTGARKKNGIQKRKMRRLRFSRRG